MLGRFQKQNRILQQQRHWKKLDKCYEQEQQTCRRELFQAIKFCRINVFFLLKLYLTNFTKDETICPNCVLTFVRQLRGKNS